MRAINEQSQSAALEMKMRRVGLRSDGAESSQSCRRYLSVKNDTVM